MTYLGIDGGGSKTLILLADDTHEICKVQTGPSNWVSVGANAARKAIQDGIGQLSAPPDIVCAGFAGAARPQAAQFYRDVLQAALPSATIIVESDAAIAYFGAIGVEAGVLLIAGTGSIAIGRSAQGAMTRVGGWGPFFGDEGSGFWIGREAVREALRALDCGEESELGARIADRLDLPNVRDIVASWSAGAIGVPEIANLFTEVMQLYPHESVTGIVSQAAAHLRSLVESAVAKIETDVYKKCVIGSVGNHPVMRRLIGIPFDLPQGTPEWGAVARARQAAFSSSQTKR